MEALPCLAYMFNEGLGGVARDSKKAAQLYQRAAQAGIAWAMTNLGFMYARGLGGLP